MTRFLKYALLITVGTILSCGTTKDNSAPSEIYTTLIAEGMQRDFMFIAEVAFPLQSNAAINAGNALFRATENNGSRIVLTDDSYQMRFINDSIQANLPYFGELRTAAYSDVRDVGKIIDEVPHRLDFKIAENKEQIIVDFKVNAEAEQYTGMLTVFKNGKASLVINGANRLGLRYNGSIRLIE